MASIGSTNSKNTSSYDPKVNYTAPLILMVTLFFTIGFITVLNDVLIPAMKGLFGFGPQDTGKLMLIQFCFFIAYGIMSVPAGLIINKVGYKKGLIIALFVIASGLLLFVPASMVVSYPFFLFALFVVAVGLAILQVAINPYLAALGPEETGAARINIGGSANSFATFIGPIIGATLILSPNVHTPSLKDDYSKLFVASNARIQNIVSDKIVPASVGELEAFNKRTHDVLDKEIGDKLNAVKSKLSLPLTKADSVKAEAEAAKSKSKVVYAKYDPKYALVLENVALYYLLSGRDDKALENIGEAKSLLVSTSEDSKRLDALNAAVLKPKAESVRVPYIFLACAMVGIALLLFFMKLPEIQAAVSEEDTSNDSYFKHKHLLYGAGAIFFYVGAEVAIGSLLVLYLKEEFGIAEHSASTFVAYYWGSAMIGRLIGSFVGQKVQAQVMLRFVVVVALALVGLSMVGSFRDIKLTIPVMEIVSGEGLIFKNVSGIPLAAVFLMVVGLFNSVMWPCIFPLGLAKLGSFTSKGSGLLVTMVAGGAFIPYLQGLLKDVIGGYQYSFVIVFACYAYLLYFAVKGYKPSTAVEKPLSTGGNGTAHSESTKKAVTA